MIEAERIAIERLADIADAIRPQDVEREGPQASDHARLAADAAVILTKDLVTNIVGAVLNTPVAPNGLSEAGRWQRHLARIVGHLLARPPQARLGVLHPGEARDAGHRGDQGLPLRIEAALGLEDFDSAVLLPSVVVPVHLLMAVSRCGLSTQAGQTLKKAQLVGFDTDQQGATGLGRTREGSF